MIVFPLFLTISHSSIHHHPYCNYRNVICW